MVELSVAFTGTVPMALLLQLYLIGNTTQVLAVVPVEEGHANLLEVVLLEPRLGMSRAESPTSAASVGVRTASDCK